MKKLHKTRDFLAGMLAMAIIVTMAAPAGAALVSKTIQVFTGLEIYVDGVKMNPTDANGKPVETFAYNGTTYVPLRAVSQSLGKNVKYDSATKRVYIGEVPGETKYLLPYQVSGSCEIFEGAGEYKPAETFKMMGVDRTNGFYLNGLNDAYGVLNLSGQYNTLSFDMGHVDGERGRTGEVNIYFDGELVWTREVSEDMAVEHVELPVTNVLQVKIELRTLGNGLSCTGLADIIAE